MPSALVSSKTDVRDDGLRVTVRVTRISSLFKVLLSQYFGNSAVLLFLCIF